MFGAPIRSGITISRVISGISKTLNVAGRVIPLYKEAKPILKNARTIINTIKSFNTTTGKESSNNAINTASNSSIRTNKKDTFIKYQTNSPTFFL